MEEKYGSVSDDSSEDSTDEENDEDNEKGEDEESDKDMKDEDTDSDDHNDDYSPLKLKSNDVNEIAGKTQPSNDICVHCGASCFYQANRDQLCTSCYESFLALERSGISTDDDDDVPNNGSSGTNTKGSVPHLPNILNDIELPPESDPLSNIFSVMQIF